jgi:hypothetical protein
LLFDTLRASDERFDGEPCPELVEGTRFKGSFGRLVLSAAEGLRTRDCDRHAE